VPPILLMITDPAQISYPEEGLVQHPKKRD
jgi:hypothetical protein